MRMKTQIASVLLAVSLAGLALMSSTTAQDDDEITIVDLSLGFPYQEDFEAGNGGWTTTEIPPPPPREPSSPSWDHDEIPTSAVRPDPVSLWEHGEPTSGPGFAASGDNAWATNLAGVYEGGHCAGLISPPVELDGTTDASVSFESWLHTDASTFSGRLNDAGMIFVTLDGGDTFTILDPDQGYDDDILNSITRECLDDQDSGTLGLGGPAGTTPPAPEYNTLSGDLTPYLGETVQIVVALGSNCCTHRDGWYVDDFGIDVDGSSAFFSDFEADDGGFGVVSVAPPVGDFPPGGAHTGDNAWATNPSGVQTDTECSGIMSPAIDISNADDASVSFQHWRHMRTSSSSGALQGGLVFATTDGGDTLDVIVPDEGYPEELATAPKRCLDEQPDGTLGIGGESADWESLTFNLEDYIGQDDVQLVIGFRGDSFGGDWSGLYIDTWTTTIDEDVTVEDFEASDGGFEVVGVQPPPQPRGWEHGEPTTGPANEFNEGNNLWATQLHRNYGHLECSWIESPEFQLGPVPNEANTILDATLSWDHWFRSNSLYASGIVQIGHEGEYHTIEPEGGYPGSIGSTSSTFEEVTQWQHDCFGHDWEFGDDRHTAYSGTTSSTGGHVEGENMTHHQADLTGFAGEDISIRYLFASGWRDVNPATHSGWYVDDIQVELRVEVTGPSPEGIVEDLLGSATNPDAPGWSNDGRPDENEWEYGLDDLDGGESLAYGTNLAGGYGHPHCGYIESPAFNGTALATDGELTIDHRFGLRASLSTATYGGLVLASADGGPWENVEFPDMDKGAGFTTRTCVDDLTGTSLSFGTQNFAGWELDWHTSTADLSAFANANEVKLRFIMGGTSTFDSGCDDENPCIGWHIRGVDVGGEELLALPNSLLPL